MEPDHFILLSVEGNDQSVAESLSHRHKAQHLKCTTTVNTVQPLIQWLKMNEGISSVKIRGALDGFVSGLTHQDSGALYLDQAWRPVSCHTIERFCV